MDEEAAHDPRWGQEDRDRKAAAILATLQLHCGNDLGRGVWLDIGCGSGGIAAALSTHVERMIGMDPEPWERWRTYRTQRSNLEFQVGGYGVLSQAVAAGSCDVVICNQVYEHVDDPPALLAAIHGVLRRGGVCYFAGPNLLWPIEPHVFWPFVHWLPRAGAQRLMRMLGSNRAADLDAWSWTSWTLTRHFRAAGFDYRSAVGERLQAGLAPSMPGLSRALAHLPRPLFAMLTPLVPGFVFVLRKCGD